MHMKWPKWAAAALCQVLVTIWTGINQLNKTMSSQVFVLNIKIVENLSENQANSTPGLSAEEKAQIKAALGKVIWYQCGAGHLYCVGECGNPEQGGKCPECGQSNGKDAKCKGATFWIKVTAVHIIFVLKLLFHQFFNLSSANN